MFTRRAFTGEACGDGSGGFCTAAGACVNVTCAHADNCITGRFDGITCVYTNNTAPCDDGIPCTTGDTCSGGVCVGIAVVCPDDGNPCTSSGTCISGVCVYANTTAACDDADACTNASTCVDGICVGSNMLTCPDSGSLCTDAGTCIAGVCVYANNTAVCDDGLFCTVSDRCAGGVCVGTARNCSDGNACTDDLCDNNTSQCLHMDNTIACDDSLFCTVDDRCAGSVCVGAARNCSDDNACTDDPCDEDLNQCLHVDNTIACDDDLFCTVDDRCVGGVCVGAARNCSDGNACTDDSCDDGANQCLHMDNTIACDDGLFCTIDDRCTGGVCVGAARNCSDGNACTNDLCDDDTNLCLHVDNTIACDDGLFCTVDDRCAGGVCVGTARNCSDGNACTDDSCDDDTNQCFHVDNTIACDDGLFCTVNDRCTGGMCTGSVRDCADDNICTDNACDETLRRCTATSNTASCDDNNKCSAISTCKNGVCLGSSFRVCDDGNDCTDDACFTPTGSCVAFNRHGKVRRDFFPEYVCSTLSVGNHFCTL